MNWAKYPSALTRTKAQLDLLEAISPGVTEKVEQELDKVGHDRMAASIKKLQETGLISDQETAGGVDNSPAGIEQVRTELIEHRNQALDVGEMRYAVLMSHIIVLLAELKDTKEQLASWKKGMDST